MILSPDDLLTGPDRTSKDAVSHAWAECRRALKAELAKGVPLVIVMVGTPGSGKTTWARDRDDPDVVIFDACWSQAGRRAALARQIRMAGARAELVWLRTPLGVCRERNARRPLWRRVPDFQILRQAVALRSSPPSMAEGWSSIEIDRAEGERVHDASAPHEVQLARLAAAPANQAWALVRSRLLPAYRAARAGDGAVPPRVAQVLRGLDVAMQRGASSDRRVAASLAKIGGKVERGGRKSWEAQVGADVPGFKAAAQGEVVEAWAEDMAPRWTELRARVAPGIVAAVDEAWAKGWTAADLEKTIPGITEVVTDLVRDEYGL